MTDPLRYKQFFKQFNGDFDNRQEIATYDEMMKEFAGIRGIPIEFYPINVDDFADGIDVVYGENSTPKWDRKIVMTAILEEFSPEIQAFAKFGIENTDEITLFIHRTTFDELVGIRSEKAPKKTTDRRGAWGPVANDQLRTPYNGLVYEVLNGGLHFLSGTEQHFGHKFWYKVTCKVRQTSDAPLGQGEQYGALPDGTLDPKWKGNPQFILPSPSLAELIGTGTGSQVGTPSASASTEDPHCVGGDYQTTGTAPGSPTGVPEDLILPNGQVADKYQVAGAKTGSTFNDTADTSVIAKEIVNPQTDQPTTPNSPEETKYGPSGRTIVHSRDLFGDWG